MAEIEEIIDGVEEAIDGAEEGLEELPEEMREEVEAEIAESRVEVSRFSRVTETLKSFLDYVKTNIPKVAKFLLKNAAIGVVFWGVNAVLNKLALHHQTTDVDKKRNVIKALAFVIKTETDLSQKVLDWMKEHKDETIILDGFEIPLESVIAKYMTPISESVDAAFKIAQRLQDKLDGKTVFNVPTGEDMREFLVAGDAFLKGFSDLIEFISKNMSKFPALGSFPVKQTDVDQLTSQLNNAKALPLW